MPSSYPAPCGYLGRLCMIAATSTASFIQNPSVLRWLVYDLFQLTHVSHDDHASNQLRGHIEQAILNFLLLKLCNHGGSQNNCYIVKSVILYAIISLPVVLLHASVLVAQFLFPPLSLPLSLSLSLSCTLSWTQTTGIPIWSAFLCENTVYVCENTVYEEGSLVVRHPPS